VTCLPRFDSFAGKLFQLTTSINDSSQPSFAQQTVLLCYTCVNVTRLGMPPYAFMVWCIAIGVVFPSTPVGERGAAPFSAR
jgi:hypothetical protein